MPLLNLEPYLYPEDLLVNPETGDGRWWVLHTNAAFEEAALEASVERARRIEALRNRGAARGGRVRARRRVPALAPTGRPAVAIVWKNFVCLLRTGQL